MKALEVDGLQAIFYQTQWNLVGPSVCNLVKIVFNGGEVQEELNNTLLVLILKTENPTCVKLYCPIILCPVVYKTITKVVANRLKEIFPTLVGTFQTSFCYGSAYITKNVVVA